ncbi:MAG: peptidoglycan-binding domain-containing protein, partial [Beijerinckiaceae bacterium]
MRLAVLCCVTASCLFAPFALAQPSPRAPTGPAQAAPDPAMEASQRAYDALPENDRRAIQESLMWTGDYNAVVGVNFGKRLYDAIRSYQKRRNVPQNGVLSDSLWAALTAEGKRARDSVRFAILDDPATGVRVGAPMRLVERSVRSPRGDATQTAQYQSADGVMALGLIAAPLAAKSLEQAFADETAAKPGRKVTYKFQRPEFFVVSGEENGRIFYSRAARNHAQMRGFTFSYPLARKGDFDRIMLAIANSFDPFPAVATAAAGAAAT